MYYCSIFNCVLDTAKRRQASSQMRVKLACHAIGVCSARTMWHDMVQFHLHATRRWRKIDDINEIKRHKICVLHRATIQVVSNAIQQSSRMRAISPAAEALCRWLISLSQSFTSFWCFSNVRTRRLNDKILHAVEPLHQLFFWYTRLCLLEIILSFRISGFTRHQRAFSVRLLPQLTRCLSLFRPSGW